MHKRTAYRWRLLITMVVGVFFAFGTFWLLQLTQNGDLSVDPDAFKNEPDYIVEKFSVVRMTLEGKPRYVISGAKLVHKPIDDSADIELPLVRGVAPGQAPLTIKARQARVDNGNTQVHLMGDVDIVRMATAQSSPMTLKTEALTVFPDEERMVTDRAVDITLGNKTMSGVGMKANNATGEIAIQSKLQMSLPPKGKAASN